MNTASCKVNDQTVFLVKDYLKNLVKAQVLSNEQLTETIYQLKHSGSSQSMSERLITKKEAAVTFGYKSTKSIDRMEKRGVLGRASQAVCGQVRYRLSDVHKLIGIQL